MYCRIGNLLYCIVWNSWLVVWNSFIFPFSWEFHHIFRRGRFTANQNSFLILWKIAHLQMVYLLKMVIFYGYVKYPEGNYDFIQDIPDSYPIPSCPPGGQRPSGSKQPKGSIAPGSALGSKGIRRSRSLRLAGAWRCKMRCWKSYGDIMDILKNSYIYTYNVYVYHVYIVWVCTYVIICICIYICRQYL